MGKRRWTKTTRYYEVHLHPDLWGQWIVTRIWGRSGTALGRRMSVPCLSYQDGLQRVAAAARLPIGAGRGSGADSEDRSL